MSRSDSIAVVPPARRTPGICRAGRGGAPARAAQAARAASATVAALLALLGLAALIGCTSAPSTAMGAGGHTAGGGGSPGTPPQARFVMDEVIVQFRAGVDEARARAVAGELGLAVKRGLRRERTYVFRIVDGSSVETALQRLRARPEVDSADPNFIIERPRTPGGIVVEPARS